MVRSLDVVKEYGWFYWIVEQPYNRHIGYRKDLFNFGDILCLDGDRTIAIQACGADLASHRDKIRENEFVIPWIKGANRELEIWSWTQRKKVRGKKATYWHCKVTDVLLSQGEIYFEEQNGV